MVEYVKQPNGVPMLKISSFIVASALFISGCATQPLIKDEQNITAPLNTSPLTILAPNQANPFAESNPFAYYDYFLDCQDDACKIGKMKYGEYITVNVPHGAHTIFIKTSKSGFMNALIVSGGADTVEHKIDILPNQTHYVSHKWDRSFSAHLLGLLAVPPSYAQSLPEENGKAGLKDLLEQHETVGGRFNGYGVKGITYQH